MRIFLTCLILLSASAAARADEWASRSGNCFEWQGFWTVDREQSGALVGFLGHQPTGGPGVRGADIRMSANVRAVIVGSDFFAISTPGGQTSCLWHGSVRGDEARGFVLCPGGNWAFVLSFRRAN